MAPRCRQWQPPSWAVVRGRAGSNGGGWRMVTGGQQALAVGGWRVVVGGRARGRWRGGAQALAGSDWWAGVRAGARARVGALEGRSAHGGD
jgi:hypothetical protein